MSRLLFLSLLVGFAAYARGLSDDFRALAVSSTYFQDFYELCPGDEFKYQKKIVNSFFTVRVYQETNQIGEYALEASVNYHSLFNSSDADQLEAIRKDYHGRLIELFGPDYLNDLSNKKNVIYQKLDSLRSNLTSFKGKGKNPLADRILGEQNRKIEAARNLSSVLFAFKTAKSPNVEDLQELFASHLNSVLGTIGDENTTMVLSKEKIVDIITKGIYQFNHYELIKFSKLFNTWRKDSGKVYYDMHLPFEQHGSKWVVKDRPCVKAKDLPDFYQLKGKVNH